MQMTPTPERTPDAISAEFAAELAHLAWEVPTQPVRRIVVWGSVAALALLAVFAASLGAAHRGVMADGTAAGCVPAAAAPPPQPGGATAPATAEQRANAAIVVNTGRQMAVPDRGLWIALAVALTESGLRNINYGDRDSVGLFQQRPSQGWGTPQQIQDPAYSSTKFYERLVAVPGWESMPMAQAAQTVQRSAFPDAYNRFASLAAQLLAEAGGAAPAACQPGASATSGQVDAVLATARAQLGKPYKWGATGPDAYDCSGLVLTAWKAAGVNLPRTSAAQAASAGARVPLEQLQLGDLLFWSYTGAVSGVHHVALYIGDGQILEAPESGVPVRIRPVRLPGAAGAGERELMPFGIRPASHAPAPPGATT